MIGGQGCDQKRSVGSISEETEGKPPETSTRDGNQRYFSLPTVKMHMFRQKGLSEKSRHRVGY
ncbi:hypothetical protein OXB_1897 [Bacillus sp. OxB-1]|nr:hypothetical protein OXB_1897 [Bacillus sp. OxB-1]